MQREFSIAKNWTERVGTCNLIILFSACFTISLIGMDPRLNPYDEGIILVGADRILAGELPYRDFWTMYGPAQFYVVAALFKIFGEYAILERVYDIAIRCVTIILCFSLIGQFASRSITLISTIAILIMLASIGTYAFPVFPAVAMAAASAKVLLRRADEPATLLGAFIAGVFTSAAALFRHDLGFYTFVACFVCLIANYCLKTADDPRKSVRQLVRTLAALTIGAVSLVGPTLAALFYNVPVTDLYQNLIAIPSTVYPKVRALPFPIPWSIKSGTAAGGIEFARELSIYIPPLTLLGVVATLLVPLRNAFRNTEHRRRCAPVLSAIVFFSALVVLFYIKGLVRVSALHMIQSTIFSMVLLGVMTRLVRSHSMSGGLILGAVALLATVPLSGFTYQLINQIHKNILPDGLVHLCKTPPLSRLYCVSVEQDMLSMANFVRADSSPSERIYVGAGRHDKLFANDVTLYFVAGRLPVTKWHDLHPGVQTTFEIQTQMISEFEKKAPKTIILDRAYDEVSEPNESANTSGISVLDSYIEANYFVLYSRNMFSVLRRK